MSKQLKYLSFLLTLLIFSCSSKVGDEEKMEKPSNLSDSNSILNVLLSQSATSVTPTVDNGGDENLVFLITSSSVNGITINSLTGVITVSSSTALGTYLISISVSNQFGETNFVSIFTVNVLATLSAPVSISYSTASLDVSNSQTGTSVSPSIDDGGSSITNISFVSSVTGISINSSTGVISVSDAASEGTHLLSIRLTNSVGSTDFTDIFTMKGHPI